MASTDVPYRPPPPPLPANGSGQPKPNSGPSSSHRPHSSSQHSQHKHHSSSHAKHKEVDKHRPSSSQRPPSKPPSSAKPQPPGIEPAVQADNRLRRETPFLANIRFKNDLPEVPGDPKLLVMQHPPDKLAAFSLSSIEKEPKRELILPADLGITLSVLDMDRFAVPRDKPALHPADLALLGADADMLLLPGGGPLSGVSKAGLGLAASPVAGPRRGTALRSAAEVSWLMRTTYISADAEQSRANKQAHANEYEARRLKQLKEQEQQGGGATTEEPEEDDEEAQRQAQIRVIEDTFAAARAPPVHRTKPDMRAVEVMEVLPDIDWWGQKYLVGHFDKDPVEEVEELQALRDPELAHQVVGRCIFKGFQLNDQEGQAKARGGAGSGAPKFLGLCVPSDIGGAAELQQAHATTGLPPEDVAGEYQWVKEYAYDLDRKELGDRGAGSSTAQQTHILRFANGRALYLDPSKVLNLRRKDAGSKAKGSQLVRPSKVTLRVREPSHKELEDANKRRRLLAVQSAGHEAAEDEEMENDEGV